MPAINVDFSKKIKPIKPMHAVGQPPIMGSNCKYFKYLSDAHIPYSRLHDVGGSFGGNIFVDVPNIFRDFDADENDEENYDFTFTDILIKALYDHGCKPVYRLGVTIENFFEIKVYRTNPPKDYAKWARICEHIIRHYNEGWADGFEYGIEYWEIWNEPEVGLPDPVTGNGMWTGTKEEYYEFYSVAATHLKKCFGDTIKIGGYACSGLFGLFADPEKYGIDTPKLTGERYEGEKEEYRIDFFYGFFDYIKKHNAPLDFFTWHSYMTLEQTGMSAEFFARELKKLGYGNVEIHLNEWNTAFTLETRPSSYAAAQAAAMLLMMQDKPVDMLCYYDARIGQSVYGGLFNPLTYKPLPAYYGFWAFGEMYHELKMQSECTVDCDGVYAVAATDGNRNAVMVVNSTDHEISFKTNLLKEMSIYLIDENNLCTKADISVESFVLSGNQIAYIKNFC
ncbi:MAG: hypothetical protein IJ299_05745 [Oscillospiraceae bacterium]|nr:hypothetical protein [Oscillospiraceae bacterium]